MKKNFVIVNSILMIVVMASMLLKSIHSFGHLSQLFSEKECHHKYTGKSEISHQHHSFDHCFVCEFTLSTSLKTAIFYFHFNTTETPFPYSIAYSTEIPNFFKGSLFALRAPPIV